MLEREGVLIQGSLCSPLKSGGFFGTFECTSKGYVERETSLASLERGRYLFRARFARLSKVVVFLALLNAPVRDMKKGKLLSLRLREGGTYSGLALLTAQARGCTPLTSIHR